MEDYNSDDSSTNLTEMATGEYEGELMDEADAVNTEDNGSHLDGNEGVEIDDPKLLNEEGECIENRTFWVPKCDDELKPNVGKQFSSIDEGIQFYKKYAAAVGFVVRLSTSRKGRDQTVRQKYLVCNKAGFQTESTSTGKRNGFTTRIGCNARVVLRYVGNHGYEVMDFVEKHCHSLVEECSRQFLKSNRKLDIGHKKFMVNCARSSLGAGTAHRLMKERVGGYSNVGALASDFHNFKRDMMAFISNADAQMVLDRFYKKKEICSDLFLEYNVDTGKRLTRFFWADKTSRRNYAAFGDIVAFDATYRTNRYSMIFAPFTGIDNHKKCVTFAAGLLMNEDVESYTWMFDCFKRAMGHDPLTIVTDQDPSMKIAIESMFPKTRHRFCMWHITSKFTERISYEHRSLEWLMSRLNYLVWNEDIEASKFDEKWKEFILEYGLETNKWLEHMFSLREYWIPASFRDTMLYGRLRTTSIAESQNSFFKSFCNRNLTLVELMMNFDSAMDKQRHEQQKLNFQSETLEPRLKTPLAFEKHAASVYTPKLFKVVQEEVEAAIFTCDVTSENEEGLYVSFSVKDGSTECKRVQYQLSDGYTKCTCKLYEKIGIPCRHIFVVYKYKGVQRIPRCMVLARWRKDACAGNEALPTKCVELNEDQSMIDEMWSNIRCCVGLVEGDKEKTRDFLETLKASKSRYSSVSCGEPIDAADQMTMVEEFAGISVPDTINIHPPNQAKNKGSGRRLKGGKQKAIEKAQRKRRQCKLCKQHGHNSRTCKNGMA